MTEDQEWKSVSSIFNEQEWEQAWIEEHLPELKRSVAGQHYLYWSLGISFVVGLVAHVGGYLLLASAPSGILGLLADLLHALGWSLWTGAVLAVFAQIIPEVKGRQIKQAVDAYEASRRQKAQAVGNRDRAVQERPDGRRAERKQRQTRPRSRARKGG